MNTMLIALDIPVNDTSTTVSKPNIEFIARDISSNFFNYLKVKDFSNTSLFKDVSEFAREEEPEYDSAYDIISPLHIKKSFSVKVRIKSISKFSPRPVLD